LAGIPGFDPLLGLRFCGGREESLVLVLQQFDALYSRQSTALLDEARAGHRRELHRLAHSLNGASGVIGASRVQKLAAALEHAITERHEMPELVATAEELQSALEALVRALRERVGPAAQDLVTGAEPRGTAPETEVAMDQIESLLGNADFAAGATYRKHAAAIRPRLGRSAERFEQLLRGYDYPGALEQLRAARARFVRGTPA
jgi:HPt (histidine-containing phosphotransfer) domain-containing protein